MLGGEYNHTSIALDSNYDLIYSFSRRYKYMWFSGCFCKESVSNFNKYTIFILSIDDEEYNKINKFLKLLERHYRIYNYIGAICLYFNKPVYSKLSFTCSTFTAYILGLTRYKLKKDFRTYTPMGILDELKLEGYNYKICNRDLVTSTHTI